MKLIESCILAPLGCVASCLVGCVAIVLAMSLFFGALAVSVASPVSIRFGPFAPNVVRLELSSNAGRNVLDQLVKEAKNINNLIDGHSIYLSHNSSGLRSARIRLMEQNGIVSIEETRRLLLDALRSLEANGAVPAGAIRILTLDEPLPEADEAPPEETHEIKAKPRSRPR